MDIPNEKYPKLKYCTACGQQYLFDHYCPGAVIRTTMDPWIPGTVPAKTLTEADVRRIVQEEIAKYLGKLP